MTSEQKNSTENTIPQAPEKTKTTPLFFALLVVGFGLVLASVAFLFWQMSKEPEVTSPGSIQIEQKIDDNLQNQDTLTDYEEYTQYDPLASPECKNRPLSNANFSGLVSWSTPFRRTDLDILSSTREPETSYYYDIVYEVGKITSGKYKDGNLVLVLLFPNGPSDLHAIRAVYFNQNFYVLAKHYLAGFSPDELKTQIATNVNFDTTLTIPELVTPKTLVLEKTDISISLLEKETFATSGKHFFCADYKTIVDTDKVFGNIYTDTVFENDGLSPLFGFYLNSPDGTVRIYTYTPPFIGEDRIPLVTWLGDSTNKDEYSYQKISSCGASKILDVADGEVKQQDLVQIGTTINGDPVYGLADTSHQLLKDRYDLMYYPEGKPSFKTFIEGRPIFFWKDPWNRFIRFENAKFLPAAECGKPVIYLYPENETRVKVQVELAGGMTVSDPDYGNGWEVIATPEGTITNLKDNKTYPYLFWEGRGGLYAMPKKGFVVKQNEVQSFLTEKLQQLGLNNKESQDFMEYWLPKMQEKPYYFITFVPEEVINDLAPLKVSPNPDTIIRVLMDFNGLEKPIKVQNYTIRTPVRKGFTVVEWGGVIK